MIIGGPVRLNFRDGRRVASRQGVKLSSSEGMKKLQRRHNLLITSPPGSGKTTVTQHLIELLPPESVAGFYTRKSEKGAGTRALPLNSSAAPALSWPGVPGTGRHRVGRYAVDVDAFEGMILRRLSLALEDKSKCYLVIDEIGKIEPLAPSFAGLILACLDDPRPVAATVTVAPHPFVDRIKIRPDTEVIPLTRANRDCPPLELAQRLKWLAGATGFHF